MYEKPKTSQYRATRMVRISKPHVSHPISYRIHLVESSGSEFSLVHSTEKETSFLQNLSKLLYIVRCHIVRGQHSTTARIGHEF